VVVVGKHVAVGLEGPFVEIADTPVFGFLKTGNVNVVSEKEIEDVRERVGYASV
jgi:hypothetical protein